MKKLKELFKKDEDGLYSILLPIAFYFVLTTYIAAIIIILLNP